MKIDFTNEQEALVTITLEEYKELLMIKGKYEELKSQQTITTYPRITWGEYKEPEIQQYKVTCEDKGE